MVYDEEGGTGGGLAATSVSWVDLKASKKTDNRTSRAHEFAVVPTYTAVLLWLIPGTYILVSYNG